MTEFGKCNGGGRRSASRQAAPLTATITTLSKTYSALIVDISQTGIRMRGDHLPEQGEEGFVGFERIKTFGTVTWGKGGECGIAFDGPLPSSDLARLFRETARLRGLSPELRAAFEDWTLGVAR
jgi:hypothetical protein